MGQGNKYEDFAEDARGVVPYGLITGTTNVTRMLVDAAGRLLTSSAPASGSTFGHLKKTVTTAGTPERVSATSLPVKKAYLCGDTDGGILMVVGGSNTVRATTGNKNGLVIIPGNNPTEIDISDLYDLWVDAETNGGILCVSYVA